MNEIVYATSTPSARNPRLTATVPSVDIDADAGGESLFRHYWRIMFKRRILIAGVIALCLAFGVIAALLTQREYSATVSIEIAREAAKVVELGENRTAAPPQDQEFYQTQYTLLQSRSLAESVVRELHLADNAAFLSNYKGDDEAALAAPRKQRESAATAIVMAGTDIIPVRLSSVVNIRYTSPDPQMAARIANSLAQNFVQSNLSRRYDATAYARQFLEDRLRTVRQRLEDSERKAVTYAGQQALISLGNPVAGGNTSDTASTEGQSLATANLTALNSALADARAKRITAQARFDQSRANGGAALPEVSSNAAINAMRQERATLQAQYEKQSATFGPDYPAQQALRQQIAELDRQIKTETNRVAQSVGATYREAEQTEHQLQAQVDSLTANVIDQRRRSIQYNIFQRDVDTNRALYNALLQQFKEVSIAGSVGTNNVSVVDAATVPANPVKPNLRLNILLSILIGIVVGGMLALVMEQLSESAITPEDFQRKLGVPLLGTIPLLTKNADPVYVLRDRKTPVSEAYFSVITGLRFVTPHGLPKTLFVTSTQPSEGKSTTSLAIAISIARIGARVLLIDADMRNPSVHKEFGIENDIGLSNVLVGENALTDVVHATDLPTLFYATAGHIPPNPAELLTNSGMDTLLADALQHYDHVVIDGPPVMGLADAPLLGSIAEATVFILETGRTRTTQARQALGRLHAVHAQIAGAVLTKFDTKREGYGYGYGYEYDYGK